MAATQVGESLQLTVIEDGVEYNKSFTESELNERGRTAIPFRVVVNLVAVRISDPEARVMPTPWAKPSKETPADQVLSIATDPWSSSGLLAVYFRRAGVVSTQPLRHSL